MIASCTQFDFQTSHFVPIDAIVVPELIDGNGGGEQALIFSPEHPLQLIGRGRENIRAGAPGVHSGTGEAIPVLYQAR